MDETPGRPGEDHQRQNTPGTPAWDFSYYWPVTFRHFHGWQRWLVHVTLAVNNKAVPL